MFNPYIYKLFNNELQSLNKNKLLLHWKTIGSKQNKIASFEHFFKIYPEFNKNDYLTIYPDLKNKEDIVIMIHYHKNEDKDKLFNKIENKIIKKENKKKQYIFFNILNELYLNKYYNFNNNYSFVLFNNKYNEYIKYNKIENENIEYILLNSHIYTIQNTLLSIKNDYLIIIYNLNDQIMNATEYLNCLKKQPNIIFYEKKKSKILIIKKELLNYYHYSYDLYDKLKKINIKKKIIINDDEIEYFQYKFFIIDDTVEIIKKNLYQKNTKIYPIHFNQSINDSVIINSFKNMLFLDLKKNIIMIYIDSIIQESFIINALIHTDFQNSIILLGGNIEYIDKYPFLESLPYITTKELYNQINNDITIIDYEFILGYFIDIYIGSQNKFNILLNEIFDHILFYIDANIHLYDNQNNIILIDNSPLILENRIVKNYSNIYLIQDSCLFIISKNQNYYDYNVNDYILNKYTNSIIKEENIKLNTNFSKYFYYFKHNNEYYLNYYNYIQKIDKINDYYNLLKDNCILINNEIKYNQININSNESISNYIFIFLIYNLQEYDYLISKIKNIYQNINFKIEIFVYSHEYFFEIENNNKNINVTYLKFNTIYEIINELYMKYTFKDIFIFYNNLNLNPLNFNFIIKNFLLLGNLYDEHQYFTIFNMIIFNEKEILKKMIEIITKKSNLKMVIFDLNQIKYDKKQSYLKYLIQNDININLISNHNYNNNYFINYQIIIEDIQFNNNDIKIIYEIENKLLLFRDKEYKLELYDLNKILDNYINDNVFIHIILNKTYQELINIKSNKEYVYIDHDDKIICLSLKNKTLKNINYLQWDLYKNEIYNKEILHFILNETYNIQLKKKLKTGLKQINYEHLNINNTEVFKYINLECYFNYKRFIQFKWNDHNDYDEIMDIKIIHLNDRYDKREYIQKHLDEIGIYKYSFFNAFKVSKEDIQSISYIKPESFLNFLNLNYVLGASGCKISHYKCIEKIDDKKKYTLILEDDVILEKNTMMYVLNALQEINEFDILYLGANLNDKSDAELIKPNILKIHKAKTTTSYIINNKNKQKILNIIEKSTNEIDEAYCSEELEKYCIYPMISNQKNLKSDIVDNNFYGDYHEKFNY